MIIVGREGGREGGVGIRIRVGCTDHGGTDGLGSMLCKYLWGTD